MKVLFLTNIPSPYRVDFFELLSQRCELTVVYERFRASDRAADWYNDNNSNSYEIHVLKGIDYSNDASIAPGVVNFLRKDMYDIIVVSGYSSITQMIAITFLRINHIQYILNVDGGIVKSESQLKYHIKKHLISNAGVYLSSGLECDEFLMYYGAEKERLRRYPFTSIKEKDILEKPIAISKKNELKKAIGCHYSRMLLSVGQPIHRKGFDVLIKAANEIYDLGIGIYIVGGTPNEECQYLLEKLSIKNVVFIDFMKKEDLSNYYMAADVFVFPTREDIWGLVINEAMAYGLPIIATNKCNAALELVCEGKNGIIINSDDHVGMAKAIRKMFVEENLERMSWESLERVRDYSINKMVDRHIEIFGELLNRSLCGGE